MTAGYRICLVYNLAIAGKNVFLGNAAGASGQDVAQLVYLSDITDSEGTRKASFHNAQAKKRLVLDVKNANFRIMTGAEVRVEGKIVHIGDRKVYFRSGDKHYAIQLGQTLADALRKPLTAAEVATVERSKELDKPGL